MNLLPFSLVEKSFSTISDVLRRFLCNSRPNRLIRFSVDLTITLVSYIFSSPCDEISSWCCAYAFKFCFGRYNQCLAAALCLYIKHKLESTWSRKSVTYQLQVGHVPLISAQSQTNFADRKKEKRCRKKRTSRRQLCVSFWCWFFAVSVPLSLFLSILSVVRFLPKYI